ncbi:MAG TPA: acetyl-CoA carboxylase biotin carboxyl carrier protein [Thermodesulfovibrio thiophilus]|uniref:acetyl-CoA carboxylase biotin carboxyl carrier protein n=1 Tax=Thermodesulfovibrio thiophilus TaxID=340095 RepID=UPI00181EEFE8|nr:acetyl-CoA carboxylase biotin carboxyl carrier protein [Thermodesulfovibrio thiophilus]HHW20702.1 acetyl-CoA carboxylase biotin carboxyl carrier protein [Thermodesulfovibrio thiophilus]HOA82776.1 acetyl-CoA carboxylase biotin carboxyl carrier protein [Thermodesulfovibrio thiophilus]HQA03534.1 acetyl-CoA carboxylase biotin carboxyl carrier protein [Thermodesulfovibrio thiophilus]HQD36917.1 acetyl-CoA carboxylase biotin carboxyl carrier protein [Thermodesulfovibrio thiophilus]
MELEEIKELISFLKDTDVTELNIEKEGFRIRIKRGYIYGPLEIAKTIKPSEEIMKPSYSMELQKEEETLHTVTSPLVGTFYRSPSPDAPPFVEIGTRVEKGQVLCIIEAMKIMNEIESDVSGVVKKILVENGQPVEYGEPLFLIEVD